MNDKRFIFQDSTGRRWTLVKLMGVTAGVVALLAAGFFIQALWIPALVTSPGSLAEMKKALHAMDRSASPGGESQSDLALRKQLERNVTSPLETAQPLPERKGFSVRAAFLEDGDPAALASLRHNAALLTHVLVNRFQITDLEGEIDEELNDEPEDLPTGTRLSLMLILGNEAGGHRVPEGVENLSRSSAGDHERMVDDLIFRLKKSGAQGVVIDWDDVDPGLRDDLTNLVKSIAVGLRVEGLDTWLCVNMDSGFDCFDLTALSPYVSHFVARLDDESGGGEDPGPLASQDWFDGWLNVASAYGDPEQWLAIVGTEGGDWRDGAHDVEKIRFSDVMSRADNAGVAGFSVEAPTFTGNFSYFADGVAHEVWFADATSFLNQTGALRDQGWAGFAISDLGSEDPGIWKAIETDVRGEPMRSAISEIETVRGGWGVPSIGQGEIVSLDTTTSTGKRKFQITSDDRVSASYTDFPAQPTLFRAGDGGVHAVALTFDDGPDPEWTPKILDILRENGVKAAFFMIGQNMEEHPELVARVLAEGHEIGNHTFTHPNLARVSDTRTAIELNATQRLLESITGRSTTLFRPPYNADSRPSDAAEINPIRVAQSLGFLTVLENIDPRDWQASDAETIVDRVVDQRNRGSIILLHDGGGERRNTVEALPQLLAYLKERGDQVVPISELLKSDRETVMPVLNANADPTATFSSGVGFRALRWADDVIRTFLVIATILVVARTLIVLVLATVHSRRPRPADGFHPAVTIAIPAFNEDKVIVKTLRSILASDYPGEMEVLVIDDGSTDETAVTVERLAEPSVRLLRRPNSGKSRALQQAVSEAKHDFIVFMDADTLFDRAAIRNLMAPFRDARVGAVSGHARVGNPHGILTRCQDLEYVCGFNLDRQAYAAWNCITVVPGAISALRKAAIVAAGGFSSDTLAEDTDLTLEIHRAGYRVDYQKNAIAYTEAPETFRTLARQRFRWAYGTLQCVWKHRDMTFNPRFKALGCFSLPGIWFFQVLLVAFSPFIDLLFLQSILIGRSGDILPYFLTFLGADLILALAAVRMEKLAWYHALMIIPQRFIYRPLLSYVIWKSIIQALQGAWVGWGKLQRTATVSAP